MYSIAKRCEEKSSNKYLTWAITFHHINAFFILPGCNEYMATRQHSQQRRKTVTTTNRLLELLLGAELVSVTALLLTAVGSTRGETGLVVGQVSNQFQDMKIPGIRKSFRWSEGGNVRSTCGRWTFRSCTWRREP
ncbi:uncharacterized protein EURHEDRAFT_90503 [Aspergillus ruber CBS 135680]|uniref:Uncharacterized protein n=1 Tax=Aspergillus ruber (strain CBS 135680) TaxID=1388766 RepID=A0A017SCB1_ASPRC|nr:uncharacterized protein EURHEDRAFT_90503 [Aspergillus ruber CBS 135680]EYE94431.1 hypothetical protein EURHEDRAFT_90503 [Aspergillus ruber CBS 135680]